MQTVLRLAVHDGGELAAYATVVLGVLRSGYRCVPLRSPLGTPIEMCSLFVHVDIGTEENLWASAEELQSRVRAQQLVIWEHERSLAAQSDLVGRLEERVQQQEREITELRAQLAGAGREHEGLVDGTPAAAGLESSED